MSAKYILEVQADPSGLSALGAEFKRLDATIQATARTASTALAGMGKSGASELAKMRGDLDQALAGLRTLQAENEKLTKALESGAARRGRAAQETLRGEQAAADAHVRAWTKATADTAKMQDAAAAEDRRRTARKLAELEQFGALRNDLVRNSFQKEIAEERRAFEQTQTIRGARFLAEQRQAERASAERLRLYAAEQRQTASLLNASIGAGANAQLTAEKETLRRKSAELAAAQRAEAETAKELHHAVRGLAGGVGQLWLSYGSLIPLVAGFVVASGIRETIKLGSEFGYQLAFVGAISNETGDKLTSAGAKFRQFAEESAFTSSEVARGARTLAQAGISLEDSIRILPDLLKFSTLGEIELAQGAEIAAGMMHAFGLEVRDIPHILDSTAKAAQLSQTTISEMGQALRQASTVGLQYNVSLDQMNALLAVLAQRNIRGSAAGTALRNMMNELDPSTERARKAFKALNIEVENGAGGYKDIVLLLGEFSAKFNEFDQASQNRLAKDYFNERGAKAFLNALREANGELPRFLELITQSDGTLKRQAETIENTFQVQGKEALHAFQNAFIEAFQKMEPLLVEVLKGFREFAKSDEFKGGINALASSFGVLIEALRWVGQLAKEAKAALELIPGSQWGDVFRARTAEARAEGGAGAAGAGVAAAAALSGGARSGPGGMVLSLANVASTAVYDYAVSSLSDLFTKLKDERDAWNVAAQKAASEKSTGEGRIRAFMAALDAQQEGYRGDDGDAMTRLFGGKPAGGTRVYNPAKDKEAEDAARLAVERLKATYREQEQASKAHFDAEMSVLRAYHTAKLIDDDTFNQREAAASAAAHQGEVARYQAYIAKMMDERAALSKKKKDVQNIDLALAKAGQDLLDLRLKREAQLVAAAAQEWAKYNNAGEAVLESTKKANNELSAQVEALKNLDIRKKDSTLTTLDGRIKTEEDTLARLENSAAVLEQSEFLTAKQAVDLAEIAVIRKRLEELKKERDIRKGLLKEREELENNWLIGAKRGLDAYVDHSLSSAKIMENGFKKAFQALEDTIFNFVKTGKFNIKDMLKSVGDDILRMLIKLNITQPLAQWLSGNLSSGGGGWLGAIGSFMGSNGSGGGSSGIGTGVSLLGTAGTFASNWAAGGVGTALGQTAIGQFWGGMTGAISGPGLTGGAAMGSSVAGTMGGTYAGLSATGWGVIIAAIIAIGMWASKYHTGGPKVEGSFVQSYNSAGQAQGGYRVSDEYGNVFLRGTELDESLTKPGNALSTSYQEAVRRFGGTAANLYGFGLGVSHDPRGNAPSRLFSDVMIDGRSVYSNARDMDDKEVGQEMGVEALRMLVAALRETDFADEIDKIFDSVDPLTDSVEALNAALAAAAEMRAVLQGLDELDFANLDVESLRAMAHEGETIGQTFQRVAGQIQAFDGAFMTEAQKLEKAQNSVTEAFRKMGIEVPESEQAFYDLVHGLDLSTEAGRAMFDTLMDVAPAFQSVQRAAQAARDTFDSLATTLQPSYGQGAARSSLEQAVRDWMALSPGNSSGWTVDSTIANIGSMVSSGRIGDARTYAESLGGNALSVLNRMLQAYINWQQANGGGGGAGALTGPSASSLPSSDLSNPNIRPGPTFEWTGRQWVDTAPAGSGTTGSLSVDYQQLFNNRYGEAIGSRGTLLDQLRTRRNIVGGEESIISAQLASGNLSAAERAALVEWNATLHRQYTEELPHDIARLTELTGEYGTETGEAIFSLEEWYEKQQDLLSGNGAALVELEEIFSDRREEILRQSLERQQEALQRSRDNIASWLSDLLLNDSLSPLTPEERLAHARQVYSDTLANAQAGDADALSGYTGAADAFLRELRRYYGSDYQYLSGFADVTRDAQGLALGGTRPPNANDMSEGFQSVVNVITRLQEQVGRLTAAQAESTTAITTTLEENNSRLVRAIEDAPSLTYQ